jgi:uncharacterized protein with transglutaminase domain
MTRKKADLAPLPRLLLTLLFAVPLLLILAKQPWSPLAGLALRRFSLLDLPPEVKHSVGHVVLLPLGAVVVVFVRVTLGIRVFGPFRSVLLAAAFQVTGIPIGLLFLAVVVASIVALRGFLTQMGLSYYGRVSAMLTAVGALVAATLLASAWLNIGYLYGVVHFPMVVLCLLAEVFAKTLQNEGCIPAVWRGGMTALVAVAITLLAGLPVLQRPLLRFPELLMVQAGTIVLIGRFLGFRLLEQFNPGHTAVSQEGVAEYEPREQPPDSFDSNNGGCVPSEPLTHSVETIGNIKGEFI